MSARTLSRLGALAVALALPLSMAPAEAAQQRSTTIAPEKLKRGASTSLLHLRDGGTIVDGPTRIEVPALEAVTDARMVGRSGDAYLVQAGGMFSSRSDILRVESDGSTTDIGDAYGYYYYGEGGAALSPDGSRVAVRTNYNQTSVLDAATGDVIGSRTDNYTRILGYGERGVLLSGHNGRNDFTSWWNPDDDTAKVVVRKRAYGATVSGNRLYYARTYRDNTCSRVVRLNRPGAVLWQTCDERVVGASPNGRRLLTIDTGDMSGYFGYHGPFRAGGETSARSYETDGMHVRGLTVRWAGGKKIARYTARTMVLPAGWETNKTLVVHSASKKSQGLVRCTGSTCKRTTKAQSVPEDDREWITRNRWSFAQQ